jgi:superfamily I DNA and/or RNA helicase
MFYNTLMFGGLNVCTASRQNDVTPAGIIWKDIRGAQVNASTNVNIEEVNEVIRIAIGYANTNANLAIGIVTPFSAQAERINSQIPAQLRGRIVADTVHKFQGDEKDVMIYSLVVTDNSPESKIKWIDYKVPNLVNVAVTRAKHLLVIVGNKTYIQNHSRQNLPLGHLVAYVDRLNVQENNENGRHR